MGPEAGRRVLKNASQFTEPTLFASRASTVAAASRPVPVPASAWPCPPPSPPARGPHHLPTGPAVLSQTPEARTPSCSVSTTARAPAIRPVAIR